MRDGNSILRNNAEMYKELNKKRIFLWILNKKVTLCHETSLNQIYRNVLESKQRMRQLPILTQTFVKYKHLQNIFCKTYDCLLSFKAFIYFAGLFYNNETVSQMRHLLSWFWSH